MSDATQRENVPSQSPSSLPQSKFGLGSDHAEIIVLVVKFFQIVGMVFIVWLIGFINNDNNLIIIDTMLIVSNISIRLL